MYNMKLIPNWLVHPYNKCCKHTTWNKKSHLSLSPNTPHVLNSKWCFFFFLSFYRTLYSKTIQCIGIFDWIEQWTCIARSKYYYLKLPVQYIDVVSVLLCGVEGESERKKKSLKDLYMLDYDEHTYRIKKKKL